MSEFPKWIQLWLLMSYKSRNAIQALFCENRGFTAFILRKQSCILNRSFHKMFTYRETEFPNRKREDVVHLRVKERILTIRLMEKAKRYFEAAVSLGILVKMDSGRGISSPESEKENNRP